MSNPFASRAGTAVRANYVNRPSIKPADFGQVFAPRMMLAARSLASAVGVTHAQVEIDADAGFFAIGFFFKPDGADGYMSSLSFDSMDNLHPAMRTLASVAKRFASEAEVELRVENKVWMVHVNGLVQEDEIDRLSEGFSAAVVQQVKAE